MPNPLTGLTKVDDSDLEDSGVIGTNIAPGQPLNILSGVPGSSTDLLSGNGSFIADSNAQLGDTNAFNIGLLGFKHAVNEGLTIFNLVDGVVDEFNDETGVDTPENSNATYDSSSDFYTNDSSADVPVTTEITSYTTPQSPATYTADADTSAVNVLVVGGGGAGGGTASDGAGGGGAGGLIYYPNYPVTGGAGYSVVIGSGGAERPSGYPTSITPHNGSDSSFNNSSPMIPLVGEGGGRGGDSGSFSNGLFAGAGGGSGGGVGGKIPDISSFPYYSPPIPISNFVGNNLIPSVPDAGGPTPSIPVNIYTVNSGAYMRSTQNVNHAIPSLPQTSSPFPTTASGSFGNRGGVGNAGGDASSPSDGFADGSGGGGAGDHGADITSEGDKAGGVGLAYIIADGSTPVTYAAGGAGADNESNEAGNDASANTGNGGDGGGRQAPGGSNQVGGAGGSGIVIVQKSKTGTVSNSLTLISDTFTANATPSKARIVVFAELPDGTGDFTVSATRDNSTFNAITLNDEGFQAGSSGIKIFTGSTPLTGSASPQVQLRWKVVGSSLTGTNKIHGVALQWA